MEISNQRLVALLCMAWEEGRTFVYRTEGINRLPNITDTLRERESAVQRIAQSLRNRRDVDDTQERISPAVLHGEQGAPEEDSSRVDRLDCAPKEDSSRVDRLDRAIANAATALIWLQEALRQRYTEALKQRYTRG